MMNTILFAFCWALVLVVSTPRLVWADSETTVWTDLGLFGGQVNALAIDPNNPDTLFAGTYDGEGLFRSTDGGLSWQALKMDNEFEGEDTFENHNVKDVAIAALSPQVVWAAHNLWVTKSMDGGDTWTHIRNSTMQKDCIGCSGSSEDHLRFCNAIAISPNDPNDIYVGAGGPVGTYGSGAVYRTIDGGQTWTMLNQGVEFDYPVKDIDIDPQNASTIWIVTNSYGQGGWGGTLYRSLDAGDTWEEIFSLTPYGSAFYTVAAKPGDPNTVFTGMGPGVYRHFFNDTAPDSPSWNLEKVVPDSTHARDIAFDSQNPETVIAAWFKLGSGGEVLPRLSQSLDGGATWETYSLESSKMESLNTLAIHPGKPEIVYGGDCSQGVFKSSDHGRTWAPVNQGLKGVVVFDIDSDPFDSTHLIAGTISGFYERVDDQWNNLLRYPIKSVRFDPVDRNTYYAGLNGYLAKTRDGGATWNYSDCAGGDVLDIEIDPTNTNKLFIADESHIRRSLDGGDSFTPVLEGINLDGEAHRMRVVTIDPNDSRRILAGGGNFYAPMATGGLWESLDGGDTWRATGLMDVVVNDVLIHPDDSSMLIAGCGFSGGGDIALFKSIDGGATWMSADSGLPPLQYNLYSIWVSGDGKLFATGIDGDMMHIVGDSVTIVKTDSDGDLNDVFGVGANTVFAVGDNGSILRFDGSDWTVMQSPVSESLYAIWGPAADRQFAVGPGGRILGYDGQDWLIMESPVDTDLYDVFGLSADDVFAVGDAGTILHYDGNAWAVMTSPSSENLYQVWAADENQWFATGTNGTLLEYQGNFWTTMSSGTTSHIMFGLWGSSAKDVWAVTSSYELLHYDGQGWIKHPSVAPSGIRDIWGVDSRHVYAIQLQSGVYRFDGQQWETVRQPGSRYRAVTDLEFHRDNTDIVYAATMKAGVYLSPNRGDHWLNLGKPQLEVNAISAGSLYSATNGGLYQLTGTGVLAGAIYSGKDLGMIHNARVSTDLGVSCLSNNGQYMMVVPSGIFDVYATVDQHAMAMADDVTVAGGDVTWMDFEMALSNTSEDKSFQGSLTIDNDNSSGGAYCFISTCP